MHDCRHTCALRMARDRNLSLRDVQVLLGHANLTTTQIYLEDDDQTVIKRVQQHHAERNERAAQQTQSFASPEYAAGDLSVLFGGAVR
jgi:integrase